MAHKIVLPHPNLSKPHNNVQATIRSSKPSRGEHEIKKTLQVSLLWLDVRMLESIIMSH